jgi:hypothetical protein
MDPEAIKQTAHSIAAHPIESAQAIGSEAADEVVDAAKHPLQTATDAAKGVVSATTNPDAQATAKQRIAQPGVSNKLVGLGEYLMSGVPLIGGNIVKSQEQAGSGNLTGAYGTLLGTLGPMLLDTEPVQAAKEHIAETGSNFVQSAKEGMQRAATATAPEGSLEAGFAKIGGKKIKSAPTPVHAGVASLEPGDFGYTRSDGSTNISARNAGKTVDTHTKLAQGSGDDFQAIMKNSGGVRFGVGADNTAFVDIGNIEPQTINNAIRVLEQLPTEKVHFELSNRYNRDLEVPNPTSDTGFVKAHEIEGTPQDVINQIRRRIDLSDAYGTTGRQIGGLKERTTGVPEIDQHIRNAGAIPAGTSLGDQALFHDPTTGSTLSLPQDAIKSPEAVQQQLTESRAKFAEADAKKFIETAPEGKIAADAPQAKAVKQFVENNGGVFRGMQVDRVGDKRIGMIYFDVPEDQVGGKKNVTTAISINDATPENIRAKVDAMAAQHAPKPELPSVQFVKDKMSNKREQLVTVDTKKLDAAWSRDKGFYLSPDNTENRIGNRYERFQQWRKDNPNTPVEAPRVGLRNGDTVGFDNGRHRFSVLRDQGYPTVQVLVDKSQVDDFKKKFGPDK